MSFSSRDAPLFLRLRTRQLMLLAEPGAERNLGRAAAAMSISQLRIPANVTGDSGAS